MAKIQLGIYAGTHFLVDLGCALLLLGRICPDHDPLTAILLYNLFAFAVQMPIGLLADRWGRSHLFAAAGCMLVALGWVLSMPASAVVAAESLAVSSEAAAVGSLAAFLAVVAAGLGNAAFHVGGGLHTLNRGDHRAGPLGLFVSPGAFGVYLGGQYAKYVFRMAAPIGAGMIILLAVAAIMILFLGKGKENAALELPSGDLKLWGAAACLFAVVILRSFLGLAADLPWKTGVGTGLAVSLPWKTDVGLEQVVSLPWKAGIELGLAAVCAVAGGKAAGGYLADRFGARPVAVLSLSVSAVCFVGCRYPVMGLAALFLFNMTMPLTLWAMAELFPGVKGFSFGLLTFGLFLGFLPVYFGYGGMGPWPLAAGAVLSLLLLYVGLRQIPAEGRHYGAD